MLNIGSTDILVTGPTGSGNSTTLTAIIDYVNQNYKKHIITIEDPVEFVHTSKKSLVNHREVGKNTHSFANALRSALREDSDIIVVGEIRDEETMSAALNFSETGHLVLSTLHANNAYQTLERILGFYSEGDREMIRLQLSQNLKGIIAQRLLPKFGGGRVAAHEIMLPTARINELIHRGDIDMIHHSIQTGESEGMLTFDQCLYKLWSKEQISKEDCLRFADRQTDLRLKIGLDADYEFDKNISLEEEFDL